MAFFPAEQMVSDDKEYTTSSSFDGTVKAYIRNGTCFVYTASVKGGASGNTYLNACTLDAKYLPARLSTIRVWDTSNSVWVYYGVNTDGTVQAYVYKSGTITNSTNTGGAVIAYPCKV